MDESDPSPGSDFTATQDCVVSPSAGRGGGSGPVCKESAGGSEANFPGSSTTTYEVSDVASMLVVVTAGAEKLTGGWGGNGVGVSATGSASVGSGVSKTTASATQATGSGAASGSSSASRSGSAAAAASTGAAAANVVVMGGGLLGAAAGLFGGLVL